MSASVDWVQPQVLRHIREQARLTPDEVEQHARKLARSHYALLTAQQLKQWESGSSSPDLEHLETLAEIYRCPVGEFLVATPPLGAAAAATGLPPLSFRGLAGQKSQQLSATTRQSLARFIELAEWFAELIGQSGIRWDVRVRPVSQGQPDIASLARQAARQLGFSQQVRKRWTSADEAFQWWRRRIEDQGVFCFQLKLDPQDVRGASLWWDGSIPFILINHQDAEAATGRLFTLLHEYCHLLLPTAAPGVACDFRGPNKRGNVEPTANRFAARTLVPLDLVRPHLREQGADKFKDSWPDAELDRLRAPLFVSRDVMAISIEELGVAPPGFYQQKRALWERRYARHQAWGRGKSITKKERKARELGASAFQVLTALEERGTLPRLDAAYMLDTKVERVTEFLDWWRESLLGS